MFSLALEFMPLFSKYFSKAARTIRLGESLKVADIKVDSSISIVSSPDISVAAVDTPRGMTADDASTNSESAEEASGSQAEGS